MQTILIMCAVIVTLAFVALVIQAVLTLAQIRHTAKAVEFLALNADGKLTALDPIVDAVKAVSNGISAGWFGVARAVYGFFSKRAGS
ncbi:MAG: hypothetical protein HY796_00750 [Elusimicrobia bacterium]|nr:hypothetical protein [Elusimicrobiota bacterium]